MNNEENVVFIGNKPPMNYVIAAIAIFQSGRKRVFIKARGRAISKAVDVAEILRKRFMTNLKIEEIKIDTQQLETEGRKRNVSSIEICLIQE